MNVRAVDEEWHLAILPLFGLEPDCVIGTRRCRVEIRLGNRRGCIWRSISTPHEQALLAKCESCLRSQGLVAARLAARGGAAWVPVDERTMAILTVWEGDALSRIVSMDDAAQIARFLGRLRHLGGDLPAPVIPGLTWAESWQERLRRLEAYERLAAERLNPTRFDLIHLEQAGSLIHQAVIGVQELGAALERHPTGVAVNEVDRHRFFRGPHGLGLKTTLGLAMEVPVRDLYRLLAGTMPRLSWSLAAATEIVRSYHTEWPLTAAEIGVIQAALRFPNDHYRLAHHYFLNHRAWPLRTFLRKQEELRQHEPARTRLIAELPSLLEEM